MNDHKLKEIAISYFQAFSEKNIDTVELFLSDKTSLLDWEINETSKEGVILTIQSI